ncbi:MAG: FKBP-type peptidyl-prolyl cis-trans isomerase, partial [Bacteriovoracaceae bacterium]|nr:FKBP-type peptidyl-prolyl cis-trans isomerase [Bacteriovoracaceae bacterium]
ADGAKETGKKYLESFLKKEDGKKTGSGLAYKIVTDGKGELPKSEDTVEVHYHGTLIDGTVFDSSKDRGKTVSFPLNRVIKGWKEGLQLIREGGKIKLVIPSDLGYGDQGAPPKIPGGSTLLFDVELIKIKSKTEIEKERKMQFSKFKDKSKIEALTKKIKAKQLKKK